MLTSMLDMLMGVGKGSGEIPYAGLQCDGGSSSHVGKNK